MAMTNQILATAIMSYICTVMGILYTLPSSTIEIFASENTTLNRVMTDTEISLTGSISCASTLIIMPFCGYLLDALGRKRSLIIFCLPQVLAWVLLASLNKVEAFICAMFLSGLSGSIFLIISIYVNELSESSIRGTLGSSPMIFVGIGMLLSYGLGGTLEYNTLNYTGLSLAIIGFVLLFFLKESPLHLMKKGLEKEAAKSIAFYRGLKPDSKYVISEIENLRRLFINDINTDEIPETEKLNPEVNTSTTPLSVLKFLRESRSSRRALVVLLILYTASLFQGLNFVQIYAGPIFASAIPNMSSTMLSLIFGIIVVLSGILEAYFIETIGRRTLLIVSSIFTGVLCLILGTLIHYQWGPDWVTAMFIYMYSITYSIGAGAVPFVLMGEIFLPMIKSFASTLIAEWIFLCSFVMLYMFTPLLKAYGLGMIFYIFSGSSFFTALFAYFYLPETKNLSVDVIQQKFLERKNTNYNYII